MNNKLNIISKPFKHYDERLSNKITHAVIHHTVTKDTESTIDVLDKRGLSYHYIIDNDGGVTELVKPEKRAWHAGGVNHFAIGIGMINMGNEEFTEKQTSAVAALVKKLSKDHNIKPWNILGGAFTKLGEMHSPSSHFNWKEIYNEIGVFDELNNTSLSHEEFSKILIDADTEDKNAIKKLQEDLQEFFYKEIQEEGKKVIQLLPEEKRRPVENWLKNYCSIETDGKFETKTAALVQAFNRQFVPELFTKEEVINEKIVTLPENQKWYALSQERLDFLIQYKSKHIASEPSSSLQGSAEEAAKEPAKAVAAL